MGAAPASPRLIGRLGLGASADFLPGGSTRFAELFIGPRLRVDSSRRLTFYFAFRPGEVWQSSVQHFFAIDIGGMFELRLSRRWLGRIGLEDVWITNPECRGCIGGGNLLPSQNPQVSLSFAYRF